MFIARLRKLLKGTAPELALEPHLAALGQPYRFQYMIGNDIVDFAFPNQMLVVEVDGNGHAESVRRDQARDRSLARAGYRVLRFSNREVLTEIDGVLERIAEAICEYWNPKAEG